MIDKVYDWQYLYILFFYQAEEMIAGIKDAFKTNLPQVKWMDEETKTKALNKVELSLPRRDVHESCALYAL